MQNASPNLIYMEKENLEYAINLIVRRGIVVPSAQIYGEIGGFYDYGPIGLRIKKKLEAAWRRTFVEKMGNLEIETSIVSPRPVFEASGHLKTFSDPLTVCSKCGYSHRTDKVLEAYYEKKGDSTSLGKLKHSTIDELREMLKSADVHCERCGAKLEGVEVFNLMLATKIGPLGGIEGYLRPETAQGIFLDFKNLYRIYGLKLPIGIAQSGKAFRNEISPRNLLIRMREFSQMELEYFFDPEKAELEINGIPIGDLLFEETINFVGASEGEEAKAVKLAELLARGDVPNKLFAYLLYSEKKFMLSLGFEESVFRFRQISKEELPHYSKGNVDMEIKIGEKYEEASGLAYRTDYDLRNHELLSKEDLHVVDGTKKLLPHVVELSIGLDRLFFALIANSIYKDERGWEVLKLNSITSPYDYAVFPLQKDDKLIGKALQVRDALVEMGKSVFYSTSGSIGKRYARSDEIGINKALTIDYTTLEDDTVTERDIITTKQERVRISDLR
ncbi:MAG: glycine--tRNA ligase [Candidatus Micrarchaeia archaeon]